MKPESVENNRRKFYEKTKDLPPTEGLISAVEFVKDRVIALDVGAGALRDSQYLLSQGFKHVIALDPEPEVLEISKTIEDPRLQAVISTVEDFDLPEERFDLINAQHSLYFINPVEFERIFNQLKKSLKKGGVLTGTLLGNRDEWREDKNKVTLDRQEVERITKDMKVEDFKEEEKDSPTVSGAMKHWHIFRFILSKY